MNAATFNFEAHLARQTAFSEATFGPGLRTAGVSDHIRKELLEVAADPTGLSEWIDVVILALDGALRTGATAAMVIDGIVAKQTKNESRVWPDWRTADPDKAIEHVRAGEEAQPSLAPGDATGQQAGELPPLPKEIGVIAGVRYWDAYSMQEHARVALAKSRASAAPEQSPYETITLANMKAGKLSAARLYVAYCELSEELKAANGAIDRYRKQPLVTDERPAFEAWCSPLWNISQFQDGTYESDGAYAAWSAWQARAALVPIAATKGSAA